MSPWQRSRGACPTPGGFPRPHCAVPAPGIRWPPTPGPSPAHIRPPRPHPAAPPRPSLVPWRGWRSGGRELRGSLARPTPRSLSPAAWQTPPQTWVQKHTDYPPVVPRGRQLHPAGLERSVPRGAGWGRVGLPAPARQSSAPHSPCQGPGPGPPAAVSGSEARWVGRGPAAPRCGRQTRLNRAQLSLSPGAAWAWASAPELSGWNEVSAGHLGSVLSGTPRPPPPGTLLAPSPSPCEVPKPLRAPPRKWRGQAMGRGGRVGRQICMGASGLGWGPPGEAGPAWGHGRCTCGLRAEPGSSWPRALLPGAWPPGLHLGNTMLRRLWSLPTQSRQDGGPLGSEPLPPATLGLRERSASGNHPPVCLQDRWTSGRHWGLCSPASAFPELRRRPSLPCPPLLAPGGGRASAEGVRLEGCWGP